MKILEYIGLDTRRHQARYQKVIDAIARDDFRQAEVRKLANITHGTFYRAKLDHTNRLLFTLVRQGEAVYALMLEVIEQHAYDKSRFLRGAAVDESKLPAIEAAEAAKTAEAVRYIHPERREIHLLDKVISFDDAQEAVYRLKPPLIVVGSAGSGKTALTLEKLKHMEGEVLYVTQSAYLAQSARELYYGQGFEREGQEATFFSFREFLESLRVPRGREATWRDFAGWFGRMRQQFKGIDAHQAFEEIRGVVTAEASGVLSRDAYRDLGVRQSIFPATDRDRLYDLFEQYRDWLAEAGLFDLNLASHAGGADARPRFDFVVVDEVQDLTNAQLALVLKTLKKPGHFLLCGDSNQIVHPNFFAWSRVKALFWRDPGLAERQELQVLRANFRNSGETTRVANTLLKVKHRRFGSIDRESNFLVDAVAGEAGTVTVVEDREAAKKDLNQKTKGSTRFAVLVLRDEDKAEARRFFQTPLLFSIHEAKGLEYENIVLYRFVSDHRAEFAEIAEGVSREDLAADRLDYRRGRDKTDKSLEIYKFYVNALYVALTRAIRNVYLIESDTRHPLLGLLHLQTGGGAFDVAARESTVDEWQKEARKLELQGKQEQADAIRKTLLKEAPVPWTVLDETRLRDSLTKVFRDAVPGSKLKQQLYEYATAFDEPVLAAYLDQEARYEPARGFAKQRATLGYKHLMPYHGNTREVLRQCEKHGVDHRTPMNLTPLMAASAAGNLALVEALLERGANRELTDHLGRNALHWALRQAFHDSKFAKGAFPALYERIAPPCLDVQSGERLVRIDRHLSEYLLFQSLWVLFKGRFHVHDWKDRAAFDTAAILDAWQHLPAAVLKPERAKRQHLSGVLSRNEVARDYAYNRRLFRRVTQGWYQFNPALSVRWRTNEGDGWVPVFSALNLPLIKEFAQPPQWDMIDRLLQQAALPAVGMPVAGERLIQRRQAEREAEEERQRRREAEFQALLAAAARAKPKPNPSKAEPRAPWGTPEARRQAVEQLRREIEEKERRRKNGEPEP